MRALSTRTFSTVFAAAKAAGLSYKAIASATGIKADRVSQIAHGNASITSIDIIERVADGLRIPGHMLGLAKRSWEGKATTDPPTAKEAEPMQRRQLLRGALTAGLAASSLTPITDVLTAASQTLTDTDVPDLAHLQAVTEQHSYGYGGRAPADVLVDLVADFADVTPLMRRPQRTATRTELCRIMGQLGGMVGVVLHDLSDRRNAYAWFDTAARAAEEAGDRHLHTWIIARKAMVPINFGAPVAAVDLAERARHTAGTADSAAATLAAAVAARAYALAGRSEDAQDALRDADRLADALPGEERADTWFGHCEQKHGVHLSHALTTLGLTRRANEVQEHALNLSSPTSTLTRTLLRLDAAACRHHDGNTLEACEAAVDALTDAPARFRTGLAHRRATDLHNRVPAKLRNAPPARALAAALAV
ncbi:helix-turn-helix transcriptional regulator [Micromonospora sp. WMMD1102]|uniref:helix-turn-helix domain-containing protein n=1 Tax=Micromonospora sp. WMMD1102 TaxID=3016105 RepID=UPI0024152BDC|nr:helix-turn-helix transcriptional regulator [Micromonospora sp. WMMD1102]MDG4787149.1 helix-turn-helix transcriptional regulator [Micromonospora sp. WMMD1102]